MRLAEMNAVVVCGTLITPVEQFLLHFFSIQFVLCLILKGIIVSPGHILPETGTETEGV